MAEPEKITFQLIRYPYGNDPTGQGFFWPEMPEKRAEWLGTKRNSPTVAEAVYQCRPGARENAVFLESDFAYYQAPDGLHQGISHPEVAKFCAKGAMVVQGWDTSMSARSDADYSVCVTALMMPSDSYHRDENPQLMGECEAHYVVMILDVFRARLDIGDLVKNGREQFVKWQPNMVVIERKAHGSALMSALENSGIPMEGVDPVDSKRERTVTAIGQAAGSVQGWFRLHRVRVPTGLPEEVDWVGDFRRELKDFSGQKGGKDDQVDAAVLVVSYGIREGGGGVVFPTGWQDPDQVDKTMAKEEQRTADNFWDQLNNFENMDDPFGSMCGRCAHYTSPMKGLSGAAPPRVPGEQPSFCRLWKTHKAAIDTCHHFTTAYEQTLSISHR